MSKKFRSKKDLWVVLIMWLVILLPVLLILLRIFDLLSLSITAVTSILSAWILLKNQYVVDETELRIVFGPFAKKIPLKSIVKIKETSSPVGAFALSMKRLQITYDQNKEIYISPDSRGDFMEVVKTNNPKITN